MFSILIQPPLYCDPDSEGIKPSQGAGTTRRQDTGDSTDHGTQPHDDDNLKEITTVNAGPELGLVKPAVEPCSQKFRR
jgi:hypothetical protein